jgi:outer membrane beta-barrel protein
MKKYLVLFLLFSLTAVFAEENTASKSLDKKLDDLLIPDDKVTPVLTKDKLFIVNTRYSSLINRHEFSLQGAHNLTADSHLDTKQAALAYRYHLNSRWNFGLRYTRYTNQLTSAGEKLLDDKQIVPDQDFAFNSQEIFATYNTIYGKLRWSSDTVVYFDQYISLGAGQLELASGKTNMGLLDLGLAFWVGKHGSMRVGIKNEFFNQQQLTTDRFMHNAMGYIEIGYLFGEGDQG